MIVMKFGGTSNQDVAAMRNVIRIVRAHLNQQPVVVISAIARATNELEQTARTARQGDEPRALEILDGLFGRHAAIGRELINDAASAAELDEKFGRYREELQRLVRGIAILGELTPRTMDAVCAYGERLSSSLVAAGLREEGVDAVWVDVKEFMITDDRFGQARPHMQKVENRLEQVVRPLLNTGKVPVTQGFIGVTESGLSTTMGRESSDYSASIIGAAMKAQRVQIWTDVDGILSADPRIVKSPRSVPHMLFQEAFELSYFGAKVLHPATMIPMFERSIPVQILNSRNAAGPGTLVDSLGDSDSPARVKSIAFKRGVTVLTVTPIKRLDQYHFWEGVYSVLTRHGVAAGTTMTSEYNLALAVDAKSDLKNLIHELQDLGKVSVSEGLAEICLVGHALRSRIDLLPRVFSALRSIPVPLVSGGASESSITLGVNEKDLDEAVRLLHAEFFEHSL